jgi:Ulp1 family protease
VEGLHWSIAAVAHLDTIEDVARNALALGRDVGIDIDPRTPSIVFMDTLGLHSAPTAAANLRNYLRAEWVAHSKRNEERARRKGESFNRDAAVDSAVDDVIAHMQLLEPAVPKQDNTYDCALFALRFVEEIILRWPECRRGHVEGITADMFTIDEMHRKREALKGLVDRLHLEHATERNTRTE